MTDIRESKSADSITFDTIAQRQSDNSVKCTLSNAPLNSRISIGLLRAPSDAPNGVILREVSLSYRVLQGSLDSVAPSLTRETFVNGSAASSADVPLNTASPSFALLPSNNVTRANNVITTTAIDNQSDDVSVNYVMQWKFTPGDDGAVMQIYSCDFAQRLNFARVTLNGIDKTFADSPYSLTAADSGYNIRIDTSGGAFVVILPAVSVNSNMTARIIISGAGNSITINATGGDEINGVGISSALSISITAPVVQDQIVLHANSSNWLVHKAVGNWA